MLRVFAVALSLAAAAPAAAQSREFAQTVNLDPGGALRISGNKGSMRVTSWHQAQVEIRARIERPEDVDGDYAAQAVEATRIDVIGDSLSLTVRSNYDAVPTRDGWGRDRRRTVPPVHYEIRAPRRVHLIIDSDRGPAWINGFEGTTDIVMDRGELEVRDVTGDVRVEIDRGERSRLAGVRGSLRLDADRTDLDIDADALDGNSSIEIDRGDVELRVPEAQRLTVRTDISRRGHFQSDFQIQWMSVDPRRSEGHINGGGTELLLESDRARIDLRRKR